MPRSSTDLVKRAQHFSVVTVAHGQIPHAGTNMASDSIKLKCIHVSICII